MRLPALAALIAWLLIVESQAQTNADPTSQAIKTDQSELANPEDGEIDIGPPISNDIGPDEPALDILFPVDGTTVSKSNTLPISVSFLLPTETVKEDTRIDITISDQSRARLIYSESAFVDDWPVEPETHLSLSDYQPGTYVITAYLQTKGLELQDAVTVTIFDPVTINLAPVELNSREDFVEASFKAEVSGLDGADDDFRYVWSIGQGGPTIITDAPELQYQFPLAVLFYDITMDVMGEDGSRGDQTFEFRIGKNELILLQDGKTPPKKPAPAAKACGCEKMTIKTKGESEIYCAKPQDPKKLSREKYILCEKVAAPPKGTCGAGETAYQCPLGRIAPQFLMPFKKDNENGQKSRFSFGFEVEAVLKENSAAKECKEGQFVQDRTMIVGKLFPPGNSTEKPDIDANGTITLPAKAQKVVIPVVPAGNQVPAVGAKNFGRDNFAALWDQKRYHNNKKITWIDRTRTTNLAYRSKKDNKLYRYNRAKVTQEFISFVSGSTGTCWCRFTLDNQWKLGDRTVTGTGITASKTKPNGFECTIK